MDKIKNKINEIINNLKGKFPFKKSASKTTDEDDIPMDSEAPTKQDNIPTENDKEEEEEGEYDEEDSFDTKQGASNKKLKPIIQIVLGALILFLVYDQFLSSPPEDTPPPPSKKPSVAQENAPNKEDDDKNQTNPAETAETPSSPPEQQPQSPEQTADANNPPPVEQTPDANNTQLLGGPPPAKETDIIQKNNNINSNNETVSLTKKPAIPASPDKQSPDAPPSPTEGNINTDHAGLLGGPPTR